MPQQPQQRLYTLDAMRGAAALMVAIYHFQPDYAPLAPLAVDFFFALSGLVLTRAYVEKLTTSLSFRRFIEVRIVRLYPLFLAGILLGAAYALQGILRESENHLDWLTLLGSTFLGVLMLPYPFHAYLYPSNLVFWSIAAELAINVLFALLLFRMRAKALLLTIALSGVWLGWLLFYSQLGLGGVAWADLPVTAARTLFSFTVGVFVARLDFRVRKIGAVVPLLAILALCAITLPHIGENHQAAYNFISVAVFLPALLIVGSQFEPSRRMIPAAAFLGDISYALYALHLPIAHGMRFIQNTNLLPPWMALTVFLIVAMAVAAAAVRFWDKPARNWLNRQIAARQARSTATRQIPVAEG